jgi:hypothetical protein
LISALSTSFIQRFLLFIKEACENVDSLRAFGNRPGGEVAAR